MCKALDTLPLDQGDAGCEQKVKKYRKLQNTLWSQNCSADNGGIKLPWDSRSLGQSHLCCGLPSGQQQGRCRGKPGLSPNAFEKMSAYGARMATLGISTPLGNLLQTLR